VVTFVDTSALLALIDVAEQRHREAVTIWHRLVDERARLLTTDYVRLEAWSLVQARFGLADVARLDRELLPLIDLHHVTEPQFAVAKTHVLGSGRKALSLVDATSFVVMREEAITHAFAFDRHFREHGFKLL
jgi:predicted nucleic acid-binding protein